MPDLNPAQRDAVSTLSGPLLVLAGAGTGKTRVITYRIAALIRHRIRPSRILAVTFTNKAAREMQERAAALLGKRLPEKPEISTFHSLCVRLLKRQITRLGYPKRFAIYDRGDQESVARSVLRELRVGNETMRPGDLLAHISRWKCQAVRPGPAANLAETDAEHLAASGYRRYQKALQAAGAVDFDDLLVCAEELLERFPDVRQEESRRFDHLLIDEYQDTNGTQYRIVKALAQQHRNLCVVGDDDQSIYGWRGAEVSHILSFRRDWPEAKVVRLEENYRSRAPILEAANRLIAFNQVRHDKVLRPFRRGGEPPRIAQFADDEKEAAGVVAEIGARLEAGIVKPIDVAVLFRTNEQPRVFETEFRRANIPYLLSGGMSFFDRKEVRDVLAYLKVICFPADEVSLLRILNTPPRGIGQSTVKLLLEAAVERGLPLWQVLDSDLPERDDRIAYRAVEAIAEFCRIIKELRTRMATVPPVDLVKLLLNRVQYRLEIDRQYKDGLEQEVRWQAVEEVVNALGSYSERVGKPTLDGFLEDMTLADRDFGDSSEKQPRNAVRLMTLHSAKGLEFPEVYLVGMEEGLLPHLRSIGEDEAGIDEERRLAYVGVTRAQDRLTLTLAKARRKWGKLRDSIPSRFLYELQGEADNPQRLRQRVNVIAASKGAHTKKGSSRGDSEDGAAGKASRGGKAGPGKKKSSAARGRASSGKRSSGTPRKKR